MDTKSVKTDAERRNEDPITGAAGAHPVGTGTWCCRRRYSGRERQRGRSQARSVPPWVRPSVQSLAALQARALPR